MAIAHIFENDEVNVLKRNLVLRLTSTIITNSTNSIHHVFILKLSCNCNSSRMKYFIESIIFMYFTPSVKYPAMNAELFSFCKNENVCLNGRKNHSNLIL